MGLGSTFTDYLDDVSGLYLQLNEVNPLVYGGYTNRTDKVASENSTRAIRKLSASN